MKYILVCILSFFSFSLASDVFIELKNTVGYIKVKNGNNYLIVETEEGAKLIKTRKDPEKILKGDIGISKEDLKIIGE
ncbi:MAG: hypothetical protein GXO21_03025 [Aquificae bacterium]|nr:hypothetical protein [Aquificota bacterium]